MTEEGNGLPELPQGWVWTTVGEIADQINPGFPSGKHNIEGRGVPHLRPMNVSRKGEVDFSLVKYVEASDYDSLREGDVLFNNTNSPALLGKTTYIKEDTNWAYSNHMTRIRLHSGPSPAWVAYSLHYLFVTGYFRMHCRHHVNQASINTGFLSERVPILLPPLPEQHRIVAKIEELFTQLDAGVAALEKAKAQLRRYRQAVLKAAVEGELTRAWREAHRGELEPASVLLERVLEERRVTWEAEQFAKMKAKGKLPRDDKWKQKYREPVPPDASKLLELPAGWVWATVEQIGKMRQYGTSEKASRDPSGIPVLRMGNIQDGKLDFSDLKYLPARWPKTDDFVLQEGDVLFNRTNSAELVGKTAVYRAFHPRAVFASYLIRVRTNDAYLPDFLSFCINSFHGRGYIASVVSQQVGQANVSGTKLSNMPIPFPPLSEQSLIVAEVEQRLSVADEMDKAVEQSLKRAERLRQSILKRAFEGKLVPQDLSDESASVLLERIKAEKARREGEGKGRKRSRRQKSPRQLEFTP